MSKMENDIEVTRDKENDADIVTLSKEQYVPFHLSICLYIRIQKLTTQFEEMQVAKENWPPSACEIRA
jgi:hypothetical protein